MTAALYDATVTHVRTEPVANRFRYGTFYWLIDIDAPPVLPRWLAPFARFDSRDHFGEPGRSIRANVEAFLAGRGVDIAGGRVLMLANARTLGHVFNPLSIFYCHDPSGAVAAVIAEVHNTYGGRHAYLLPAPTTQRWEEVDKRLYVSPFYGVDGRYRVRVTPPGEHLSVSIVLEQPDRDPFVAVLTGTRRPATTVNLIGLLWRYPWPTLRVSALIRFQGIRMWARGLPIVPHPPHRTREAAQ